MTKFVLSAISLEGPSLLTVPRLKNPGWFSKRPRPNLLLAKIPNIRPTRMVMKAVNKPEIWRRKHGTI